MKPQFIAAKRTVNDWLAELYPSNSAFSLDRYGQCSFVGDDGILYLLVVSHTAEAMRLDLGARVWSLPEYLDDVTYQTLTAVDKAPVSMHGGCLGIDLKSNSLFFSYSYKLKDSDFETFSIVLKKFFKTAQKVRRQLADFLQCDARQNAAQPEECEDSEAVHFRTCSDLDSVTAVIH